MGKSIAAICRYLWCYQFGTSNSEIAFYHKDSSGSKDNLKSLRAIRDSLPSYLQMSSAVNQDGKKLKVPNTVVMMQHPFNNNRIVTKPGARTKEAANNLGRGATMPLIYMDEFAFLPWNEEVLMAAVPANSRASENAAKYGAPYGITITTTPGDLLTSCGSYAYEIRNKAIITFLFIIAIWTLGVAAFVAINIYSNKVMWPIFVWCVPLSATLLIYFNLKWGKRLFNVFIFTIMLWGYIAGVFLQILYSANINIWPIFLVGIPIEIAIILWAFLKHD
jgi:hypothetical protein